MADNDPGRPWTHEEACAHLVDEIDTGRVDEIGDFLLSHLADWGPDGIDVKALAEKVWARRDEG